MSIISSPSNRREFKLVGAVIALVVLVVQFHAVTMIVPVEFGKAEVKSKRGPRLFLHVGPGKMGTTTIQHGIDKDRNTKQFVDDNLCPLVDTASFLLWTRDLNRVRFNITPELTERRNVFGADLRKCAEEGFDVVLSSEFLGDVPRSLYKIALEPIFEQFELQIVVGYRRFYDWLPSLFFQIVRMRSKDWSSWPDKGRKLDLLRFYKNERSGKITELYTEAYIDNWLDIVNTTKNIMIYNLHEDKDLVKTFYCNTLHAWSLCKKYSSAKHHLSSANVGFATYFDSIAVAAYHKGLVKPDKVTRQKAAEAVESHFKAINVTASKFPKNCFPEDFLEEILQKTKRVESTLLPDFFHNDGGENTMEDEIEHIKTTKYCTVAVDEVLELYDLSKVFL